ncbi:hypothetical protein CAEBREN_26369 [Caenorhabditis brenneri]|uniref:Uncharacterized protein n=1 Tax=Caenorhabditis brenneri TaxID=135651 RepID=G0NV66_CAEBE|nr:hypothetical protein CAEBREN_26369 [Caenorhabditis brenneri]
MKPIAEFKTVLSADPVKGVKLYEQIVEADDDAQILEASESLANYIRHSSAFKRRIVFSELLKCSLLSRLYLGLQFKSFEDSTFPRKLIFEGSSLKEYELHGRDPDQRHYVTSVGSNRCFNLGLLSDGSPVPEPRVVDLPRVTKIEMSNQHTVFLTADNRIFGCGKLSSFMPEITEKGGYVAEPTLVPIPLDGVVTEIRVTDGGSQFCVGGKWYFVGNLPPNSKNLERISSNCHVSTVAENVKIPNYQVTNVDFDGRRVIIYLKKDGPFLFWDLTKNFHSPKYVQLILNGIQEGRELDDFQVLSDGTLYIGRNGILKGKLELWKNADDGFEVKNGTLLEHFDTKYSLIALLEEVPGSNGTEFFRVSPDGQNLIMKKGHGKDVETSSNDQKSKKDPNAYLWKSINHHLIIEKRQAFWPVDIPMDLTIGFLAPALGNDKNFRVNCTAWKMVHPREGPVPGADAVWLPQVHDGYQLNIDWENQRFPNEPQPIYLPPNTPPDCTLYLKSDEGELIACHKHLHLLHSQQAAAHLNFQSTLFGSMEPEKPMEIKAEATAQTVKNALTGMCDLRTLYRIKIGELIECIYYYSYHMMEEMFSDAMYILIDTITEFNVPSLYFMYQHFPEAVIDGLVERPELLFYTLTDQPPKELLVGFAKKYTSKHQNNKSIDMYHHEFSKYDPEYVIKSMVNMEEDSEDVIWSSLREELSNSLDLWHSEMMKRKEEKKPRIRNRNSNSRRISEKKDPGLSMTSSPKKTFSLQDPLLQIPIGGRPKTDSFSKSAQSPIAQSPLAFSMSPMSKALPKPRHDSITDSFEDFPEMGSPAPSTSSAPRSTGRFAPKGAKFKKDTEILKTPPTPNPWKRESGTIRIQEEEEIPEAVDFDEVVKKEMVLQMKISEFCVQRKMSGAYFFSGTGNKKQEVFVDIEKEDKAMKEILEYYRISYGDEAHVFVELTERNVAPIEDQQIVWGNMPGLVRR